MGGVSRKRAPRPYQDLSRPRQEHAATVEPDESGMRLDRYLVMRFPWRSRTRFVQMLEEGAARLNGRGVKPSTRVREGDRVCVDIAPDPGAPEREVSEDLVLLYEDEWIVVVDKPSGMAVHPAGRIRHGTLVNKLHGRYRTDDPAHDRVPRLGHRLDLDTSGIVLAVLDGETDAAVMRLFAGRAVQKTYLALVEGVPTERSGEINAPLGRKDGAETDMEMAIRADGLTARTSWRVREAFSRHAFLELDLHTGRTHQLRVHLASIGHPIVGDHLYGDCRPLLASMADPRIPAEKDAYLLERLALHAWRLRLPHPRTGAALALESPIPPEIERALSALRLLGREPPSAPRPRRLWS